MARRFCNLRRHPPVYLKAARPGYYAMNVNDRELVTISVCETKAGTTETTRRAADFVKKDPLKDALGTPKVSEGELLVVKETIGAR